MFISGLALVGERFFAGGLDAQIAVAPADIVAKQWLGCGGNRRCNLRPVFFLKQAYGLR